MEISKIHMIVDKNFKGTEGEEINNIRYYKTIQNAVNSIPLDNSKRAIIFLKKGSYYEKLVINSPNISMVGEDLEDTVIWYDVASGTPKPEGGTYGTSGSASVTVNNTATNFTAENITFANMFDETQPITNKQAVAMRCIADKSMFRNCKFIGNQDTLYVDDGIQYFANCYIEGDVDFIFGAGQVVFENCTIFSVERAGITPKGYITAASTFKGKLGFLFIGCKLLSNIREPNSVYLGRPWHPSFDPYSRQSNVVFRDCYMDAHIKKEGWTAMSSKDPTTGETIWFYPETEKFYEYQSYGPGASVNEKRLQLSGELLDYYSKENFIRGWDLQEFVENLI
ncbi:MAG: pectinesterase family protein [Dictyoglomaceae bacterium]|nr:pectinesterase family protein [Dictyoglomaceae bacterium]HPU43913.1 pectinesterase family protein [Dictyoglomaceae bacterium]